MIDAKRPPQEGDRPRQPPAADAATTRRPQSPLPAARPRGDEEQQAAASSRASSPSRRPGGKQADDNGRQGVVCRLNISTSSKRIRGYRPASRVTLAPQVTGFTIDSTGDGVPDPTSAFPNQMQSIVIRGNQAYLPNIAASPNGPLRFNVDTQAFVNVLDGARSGNPGRRRREQVPEPAPRRAPARGRQEEAVLRQRLGDRVHEAGGRQQRRTWCRPAATCS